jgi:hypothetical protein
MCALGMLTFWVDTCLEVHLKQVVELGSGIPE